MYNFNEGSETMNPRVIIKEYQVNSLNNRAKIVRVILPKDYFETDKSYPVLYMHDGQNLIEPSPFSNCSWEVMKTMDELHDLTKGIIIVGIDSHSQKRILEYSPFFTKSVKQHLLKEIKVPESEIVPEADEYGEFIVEQLKPIIDLEYRTLKDSRNTFIAGSSCGGNISIYLGLKYQTIFSVIGAFSPAYWFVRDDLFQFVKDTNIDPDIRLYHDMGTKENGNFSLLYLKLQKTFEQIISKKISDGNRLMIVDEGALHSECYWAKRFKLFLEFLYKG